MCWERFCIDSVVNHLNGLLELVHSHSPSNGRSCPPANEVLIENANNVLMCLTKALIYFHAVNKNILLRCNLVSEPKVYGRCRVKVVKPFEANLLFWVISFKIDLT